MTLCQQQGLAYVVILRKYRVEVVGTDRTSEVNKANALLPPQPECLSSLRLRLKSTVPFTEKHEIFVELLRQVAYVPSSELYRSAYILLIIIGELSLLVPFGTRVEAVSLPVTFNLARHHIPTKDLHTGTLPAI